MRDLVIVLACRREVLLYTVVAVIWHSPRQCLDHF